MRYARFLLFVSVFVYTLPLNVFAQHAPYTSPQGNVGSWSWGRSQPKYTEEGEEEGREPGETSWERMQSEREPEESDPPQGEILKSLSPLSVWRWWRGEKKPKIAETPEGKGSSETEKADSELITEPESEEN